MTPVDSRVKIIPIEQPFLRVLAWHVKEELGPRAPDFSDILVVFPSERNKLYFRRYLLEACGLPSIIPPAMKTVEELFAYAYEQTGGRRGRLLGPLERNVILKNIIDKLKIEIWQDLPFLRFVSIGERLLDFFDELARERVTLEGLEEASALGHYPEKYARNELPILRRIYDEYRKALAAAGAADTIDVNSAVYEYFDAALLSQFEHVIVAGLAAVTAVGTRVLKAILAGHSSELVLHSGPPGELDESAGIFSPYHVHYKLCRDLGLKPEPLSMPEKQAAVHPAIRVRALKNEAQQTFHLQSVLRDAVNKHPELHRIGIILADETILISITESLRALGIEHNVSAGIAFRHSVLYSFLMQLYEMIESGHHFAELTAFIRHPLVKNAVIDGHDARPLVYALEAAMIADRRNYLEDGALAARFEPLTGFIRRCGAAATAKVPLAEYANGILGLLGDLLAGNKELMKTNPPGIGEFLDRIHEFAALRLPEKDLPEGSERLAFMLRVIEDGSYRVHGDAMRGIQIIGVLEARNLDFDCLILPSMNEGVFPRRSEKDMFVDQSLRRAAHLPTSQERDNLYYYYFTELTEGKKEIFISYVAEENRDIDSRFIKLAFPGVRHDDTVTRLLPRAFVLPRRAVSKSKRLLKVIRDRLNYGLSPTALGCYRACPYGYYMRYILGIAEPETIVEEPGIVEWGSIVHAALQNFYTRHFPRGLKPGDLNRACALMDQELAGAMANNPDLARRPRAIARLEAEIYRRHLRQFLGHEMERFGQGFEICQEALERKEKHTILVDDVPVRLAGIPDRIDTLGGRYYIIDYKTGRVPKKKEYEIGDDFRAFQLPLYALAFSKGDFGKIGGMLYYAIDQEPQTRDIVEGRDAAAYLDDFQKRILVPTVQQLIDPDVPFAQADDPEACRFCAYTEVCGKVHGPRD